MSKLYRIKDWNKHYENNRTRELKRLDWVPVPINHDGDGYTLLTGHDDAPALLGCWLAIVQVAAKCDPRGTLLRRAKMPHDAASLARITRLPQGAIQRALNICEHECNWLETEELEDGCENPAPSCENPALGCLEGKGREGKGKKGVFVFCDSHENSETTAEQIYQSYPIKVGKPDALRAIEKQMREHCPRCLLSTVEAYALRRKGNEKEVPSVPHPATWFNQQRFNDSPETWGPDRAQKSNSAPREVHSNIKPGQGNY